MNAFARGAGFALSGVRWLTHRELRLFVLAPMLVNVALFGALIWWASAEFRRLTEALVGFLPDWLDWLSWLAWPLFVLAVLLVVLFGFTVVANLVASPFNGYLSERMERLLSPAETRDAAEVGWRALLRAPLEELGKLAYFATLAVPLLLLTLVPGLNLAAPALWAVFGAWMLAVEYAEYPMGNHGLTPRAQRSQLREQRWLALGFGAGVMLLTAVPFLNLIAMPAAVLGATRMWVEEISLRDPARYSSGAASEGARARSSDGR